MSFLDNLIKYDSDIADNAIKEEYGLIVKMSSVYPTLKTSGWRKLSVIQFSVFVTLLVTNGAALSISLYLALDDITLAMQTFHFIVMNAIAFGILVTINFGRQEFSRFHHDLGENNKTYDEETLHTVVHIKANLKRKQQIFNKSVPSFIVVGGLLIVFLGPISDYFVGKVNTNVYTKGGVSINLPVPCWTPFGSDTLIGFLISMLLQAGDHFVIVTIVVSTNIIMVVMTRHMYNELLLLISALERLPERAANIYQKLYGKKYEGNIYDYIDDAKLQFCYDQCLKENVIHHQKIIRLFHDMSFIWNNALFVFFFISAISIAMSGILLMFGNGEITTFVNSIAMGITEITDVLVLCWCGKSISQASEDLYYTLYKTKWFNVNKKSAKIVLIMMEVSKNPLTLCFNPLTKLPANLETFSTLMNTAYSYFNLLYAFKENASH